MSRTIERGKALVLELIDGLQEEIEQTGLVEDFTAYLVEQNYVSEAEKSSLPNSAKQICDLLASRFGSCISDTADTLLDFGRRSGMLSQDEDEEDQTHWGKVHDWQKSGF